MSPNSSFSRSRHFWRRQVGAVRTLTMGFVRTLGLTDNEAPRRRAWMPGLFDIAIAIATLVICVLPIWARAQPSLVTAATTSIAVMFVRRAPLAGLVAGWAAGALQLVLGDLPSFIDVALGGIIFTAATKRSTGTTLASACSALVGGIVGGIRFGIFGYQLPWLPLARLVQDSKAETQIALYSMLPLIFLGGCWFGGFAVRSRADRRAMIEQHRLTERARQLAEENARLAAREADMEHTRAELSRDVHDVVGHSLTVIILQADAWRFSSDDDERSKLAVDIASTARRSLEEVRAVLSEGGGAPEFSIDQALQRARSSGFDVKRELLGFPVELSAGTSQVLALVLREMITNAMRHGLSPIVLRQEWGEATVALEVENRRQSNPANPPTPGNGLQGMAARLAAVDGALSWKAGSASFVIRAEVPLT